MKSNISSTTAIAIVAVVVIVVGILGWTWYSRKNDATQANIEHYQNALKNATAAPGSANLPPGAPPRTGQSSSMMAQRYMQSQGSK